MQIRAARIEDSAGVARVQVDSYQTAYAGIFPQDYLDHFTYEEQTQDWRDLLSGETRDLLSVAVNDSGEVIGYALGRPGPAGVEPYDCELVALHVRKPCQGHGVGGALMAAMAERLRQAGCTALLLWVLEKNGRARAVYEHLGGQPARQQTIRLGDEEDAFAAIEVAYGWPDISRLCST